VQARGRAESVLAADRDQPVDAGRGEVLGHPGRTALLGQGIGPRGAEDGPAPGQDAADLRDAEGTAVALERAPPPIPVADELVSVDADAFADDGTDHRVQAGTVAAAGEHSDSHRVSLELSNAELKG